MFLLLSGCCSRMEDLGLAYSGETQADHVQLLVDEAWMDESGTRQVHQEIFDAVFEIIDEAEGFILLDFFLVNDFMYEAGPGMRPLSQEIADHLLAKRRASPAVKIIFITDPINTIYGSMESPQFKAMQEAGIQIVWTELNQLRDSNPIYSKPWRLLVKPWGVAPGDTLSNPLGEGRVSLRSMLKLLNFKANHRKLVVTEKSLLVASANPHSASSAHWNVALRIDGAGMELGCESESAILRMSGQKTFHPDAGTTAPAAGHSSPYKIELLTEQKIEDRVVDLLDHAQPGSRIDLGMFYFSDRHVNDALLDAKRRGCDVRVILDPNKDAFGRTKNGIPNRQTAAKLVHAGIPLRWADTHGEQFHVKILYVEHPGNTATVLLGSCNFTRRNMDNFNAECSMACTASMDSEVMGRVRDTFERWWSNPGSRLYTAEYSTYADPSRIRKLREWLMETTGLSSF